ncbi:MAG TPA: zinc ribbon domain-containing protein [Verrucomicrobiae bacterium]|nr:zinc ribbon domain-containing protein [Verrucomicrobiae bacterium]
MASFCTNCAAPLDPGAKFCGACGAAVEDTPVIPSSQPVEPAWAFRRGHKGRYPALRIVATIFKVLAVISAIGGIIAGVVIGTEAGSISGGNMPGGVLAVLVILGSLLNGVILWSSSEMIHVFLDIEENTRRAVAH